MSDNVKKMKKIINHSEQEYRLYAFVNSYLSGIQKGLQTVHLVAEMSKFKKKKDIEIFKAWVEYGKTIIILDGGNQSALNDMLCFLKETKYPTCLFREDYSSLNNCLTVVGVILPKEIYKGEKTSNLYDKLKEYRLAV
jgi:hypothetical protein